MQSKNETAANGKTPFGLWLDRMLPFEHVSIRYACCLWLALSGTAAAWALFVVKPATDTLISRSSYLIELEEDLTRAQSYAETFDLPALRERAAIANKHIHREPASLDLKIVEIVEQLKVMGWSAVVASVERDTQSSERLAYASYRLELKKSPPAAGSNDKGNDSAQPISADILSFLQKVAASEQRIAIDHLEVLSEGEQVAKVFATLSAAIAK